MNQINIQRRPRETIQEYEKRKKRLRAQGFGSGSMLNHNLPLVPKVISSVATRNAQGTAVLITWDRPMIPNTSAKLAFTVLAGTTPVTVTAVTVDPNNPNILALVAPGLKTGDVITWAYNDQHPQGEVKDQNNVEPDNQTYGVQNNIPTAFTKGFDKGFK